MRYLVTHAERENGYDPKHTKKGLKQIESLIPHLPDNISLIIVGTGERFMEIKDVLFGVAPKIPVSYSPFCGSADGLEPDGSIIIDREIIIPASQYEGMIRSNRSFNAWKFIYSLPDNCIFCAGGELLIALGAEKIKKRGCLYTIKGNKKIDLLAEGWAK